MSNGRGAVFAALTFIFLLSGAAFAEHRLENNNIYMEGYIRSMLHERYQLDVEVQVRKGEVFLPDSVASRNDYEQLIDDISKVEGVKSIKLVTNDQLRRVASVWALPHDTLFRPLVADPRWPRFAAGYSYYSDSIDFKNTFDAAFGKSFSLLRGGLGESMYTEIGLQASVFAIFDLDTSSFDLINADYFIGIPVTFQWDSLTLMTRIYHQSSHLGDEYILNCGGPVERINLSYEALDMLVSFEPTQWFRIYGGGGYIFDQDPGTYGRWLYQAGVELRIVADSSFVPTTVIALDIKGAEETYYTPSWSAKLGLEVTDRTLVSLDLYDGYSPDGQFYSERITKFGISLSFY